jgi:hypothetical protein
MDNTERQLRQELEEVWALLRAERATRAAPTAPTEAMELAGMRALRNTYRTATGEYSREQARACWDAMVAAAPERG